MKGYQVKKLWQNYSLSNRVGAPVFGHNYDSTGAIHRHKRPGLFNL